MGLSPNESVFANAIMLAPKGTTGVRHEITRRVSATGKEAEIYEKRAIDRMTRAAWEKIVVGYLELSEIADGTNRCGLDNAAVPAAAE